MPFTDSNGYLDSLFGLKGKTAVVIGGTGVLCGAMAEAFWKAGANIVLVGRDADKAEAHRKEWNASEDDVKFAKADVVNRADVDKVIEQTLEWFGSIDIWVNGAGINSATPYLDIEEDEFDRILSVNLKATHLACQAIGKHWLDKEQGGSIINLSSMSAIRPLSRVFTYSVTKAAVWNLTQNLAREWAEAGIRVNALCPGFFPAEQNRKILDPGRIESIMNATPMRRFGEKEELAAVSLLLASETAGSFITGSSYVVDGGFAAKSI